MASSPSTISYLVEQMRYGGDIRSRKMFGEYAIYCNNKVIALVCDDRLYIKPTVTGRKMLGEPVEAPPYPGAKPYFLIDEDRCEDAAWLSRLVAGTAAELPVPPPKRMK